MKLDYKFILSIGTLIFICGIGWGTIQHEVKRVNQQINVLFTNVYKIEENMTKVIDYLDLSFSTNKS